MAERRRYTRRQKATAISVAMASSAQAAAEETGIPRRTIGYWLDKPEFAELRQKTRDDLAQQMGTLAHLIATKLSERLDDLKPGELVVALGIVTDKAQLLSGAATSRTETKTLSDDLNDHEKQQLRDALDRLLADAPAEGAEPVAVGAGTEVRE